MSNFKEEFQKLMRALHDSLERESELQRQLRRTKESLISVALRLQVAIKVAKEDELTIASLQTQAADARTKELLANRQAHEAADMIEGLTLEINALKRKLKAHSDAEKTQLEKIQAQNNQLLNEFADLEVDEMLEQKDMDKIIPLTNAAVIGDKKPPESATPFERWKMNHFIFSPDTPAASEAADKHVVDMLLEAATAEFEDDIHRPTISGLAKLAGNKRSTTPKSLQPLLNAKGRSLLTQSTVLGADVFETMNVDFLKTPDVTADYIPSHHKEDKTFFLSMSQPSAMWGQRDKFERRNMGRLNLWTAGQAQSKETGSPPRLPGSPNGKHRHGQFEGGGGVAATATDGGVAPRAGGASPLRTIRHPSARGLGQSGAKGKVLKSADSSQLRARQGGGPSKGASSVIV